MEITPPPPPRRLRSDAIPFSEHPRAKYWSKKNELKPHQISSCSHTKCWFDCPVCFHDFDISLGSVNGGSWCPYCSVPCKKLCGDIECEFCREKSFDVHPKAKYWSDKNKLKPHQVTKKSHKKCWFDCPTCPHDFDSALANITNGGNWCPYCSNQKRCGEIGCELCFNKSFACHKKAKYWSDKNDKKPHEVALNSHTKYLFDCDKCPHSFLAAPHTVNGLNCWCPYCANRVCGKIGCKFCFNKSFASHEKAKYWAKKNKLKPHQVALHANKKFLFDCPTCPHLFPCDLGNINIGRWCPYCAIPNKKLCGDNECKFCLKKSFASHKKAECWSDKNSKKPHEVALNSNKKFLFSCEDCGELFSKPCSAINRGSWCPYCKTKTETKLFKWLLKRSCIKEVKRQYKPKWFKYHCIIKGEHKIRSFQYSYDFLVTLKTGKQVIIELDGPQHFVQVSNWKAPFFTQIRDAYKERCARCPPPPPSPPREKISTIRILQEDVWYDRNDWEVSIRKKLVNCQ